MGLNLQTFKDIRNFIAGELKDIYPEQEIISLSEILIKWISGTDRLSLLTDPDRPVSLAEVEKFVSACADLRRGKPIQYITREILFYRCRLKIKEGVFIPRPETEELVDIIINENKDFKGKITDIGTGSGCIAIALAANLPAARLTATDISDDALAAAKENAVINNVKIDFVKSDILNNGLTELDNTDILVSNPPYVLESEKPLMHINVLDFEPHEALFVPDEDPLLFYRAILEGGKMILNRCGKVYFEINETMGNRMLMLMESMNFSNISLIKDINGKERIIKGIRNG